MSMVRRVNALFSTSVCIVIGDVSSQANDGRDDDAIVVSQCIHTYKGRPVFHFHWVFRIYSSTNALGSAFLLNEIFRICKYLWQSARVCVCARYCSIYSHICMMCSMTHVNLS